MEEGELKFIFKAERLEDGWYVSMSEAKGGRAGSKEGPFPNREVAKAYIDFFVITHMVRHLPDATTDTFLVEKTIDPLVMIENIVGEMTRQANRKSQKSPLHQYN